MYDELVAWLRSWSELPAHCECYESCDECDKQDICSTFTNESIITKAGEAADAIEELTRKVESLEAMREISPEAEYAIDKHADSIISQMDELISELKSKPCWISVEERLPEKYEVVIALNKRGKQHDIDKAYWNGFGFYRHYRKAPYSNVTHWMPLPKPPKEET